MVTAPTVAVLVELEVGAEPVAMVKLLPLLTVPVRSSVPPEASDRAGHRAEVRRHRAEAAQRRARADGEPRALGERAAVSSILPLVMLSAALIVRLPLAPISSVWLALLMAMAPAVACR